MENRKIDPVFELPIIKVMRNIGKSNKHGIRVQSETIPPQRDGINEWFKKFTI